MRCIIFEIYVTEVHAQEKCASYHNRRWISYLVMAWQIVLLSPPWLFELLNSRFQYFTLHVVLRGLKKVQPSISTSSEDTADFLNTPMAILLPKTPTAKLGEATKISLQGKDDPCSHRAWTIPRVQYKQGRTLPPVGASSLALVRRRGHDGQ